MVESLNIILNGSATSIKNKNYMSSEAYIKPFIERLQEYTSEFICHVKPAEQVSYDENKVNLVYNRVLIMGIFPDKYSLFIKEDNKVNTYRRVVCMCYALDTKTPICKFYTGMIDDNNNFYSFGGNCIDIQKLEPDTPIDYTPVSKIIENGLNDNCATIFTQNVDRCFNKDKMFSYLGTWIDFTIKKEYINDSGRVKLSDKYPIDVYKNTMIEKDSDFYMEGESIPMSKVLTAFVSQITEDGKELVNRYEKTQLINQMLKL